MSTPTFKENRGLISFYIDHGDFIIVDSNNITVDGINSLYPKGKWEAIREWSTAIVNRLQ